MPCSPKLKSCVDDLIAAGQDEASAWAICRSQLGESVNRSRDFQRIHDEFVNYYKERVKGESEYDSWVRALHLDESKPYSECQESFRWAKDMLRPLKEDADNKYYQITVGFPVRSMNGNLYKERDLIAAALSLKGKHPSLNHKDEFWFRPGNKWGTLTAVDGKYEDGAVEAILQVPKTAVCPICNGAKMTDLIDSQRIVNISLEGDCKGGQCVTGECEGFTFLDPPFTLLTTDVLPGIPLARIKPLEAVMVEALQASHKGEKRKMKIKTTPVKEDDPGDPHYANVLGKVATGPVPTIVDSSAPTTAMGTPAAPDDQHFMKSGPAQITDNSTASPPDQNESLSEPFAGYTAFADCVSKNQDKGDPEAYCDSIKAKTETLTPGDSMPNIAQTDPPSTKTRTTLSPEHTTTLSGTPYNTDGDTTMHPTTPEVVPSDIRLSIPRSFTWSAQEMSTLEDRKARVKAELKAATAEEKAVMWEQKHDELYKQFQNHNGQYNQMQGVLNDQKTRIETLEAKRDEAFKNMHNSQIERDEWHTKYEHQLGIVEDLKVQIEKVRQEQSRATEKYSQTLKTNLELSQKLTKANEDYLEVAKAKAEIGEKLTTARTNAKKTLKLKI